jgi:hypothetical protein
MSRDLLRRHIRQRSDDGPFVPSNACVASTDESSRSVTRALTRRPAERARKAWPVMPACSRRDHRCLRTEVASSEPRSASADPAQSGTAACPDVDHRRSEAIALRPRRRLRLVASRPRRSRAADATTLRRDRSLGPPPCPIRSRPRAQTLDPVCARRTGSASSSHESPNSRG